MTAARALAILLATIITDVTHGQMVRHPSTQASAAAPVASSGTNASSTWRVTRERPPTPRPAAEKGKASATKAAPVARRPPAKPGTRPTAHGPIAQVSASTDLPLPREAGQVWHEYDIRPFTSQFADRERPEQLIVDWVLRETGTECWFTEPLGILSAHRDRIRVYHTREKHRTVADIVDRFVRPDALRHEFHMRLVTLSSTNWRTKPYATMEPIVSQTPGVEAWLLSREHAALLLADLRQRVDYQEHNSPQLVIHNGQTESIARTQPVPYIRSLRLNPQVWPGYETEAGQLEQGFTVQLSPLITSDERTVDADIRCQASQVEKLRPVSVPVPSPANGNQTAQIHVPQTAGWQLHERFRWPADRVLLVSCGVVAPPESNAAPLSKLNDVLSAGPQRRDVLLFVESKGKGPASPEAAVAGGPPAEARTSGINYRGRY